MNNKRKHKFIIMLILFFMFFMKSYSQLVSDFKVNDDSSGTWHRWPKIGLNSCNGYFIVTWLDDRVSNFNFKLYCQLFDKKGLKTGKNFKVNFSDSSSNVPSISVSKSGRFCICWEWGSIKLRIFDKDGIPQTQEIYLNDSTSNTLPDIVCDSKGNYIIVWRKGYYQIRYQKVDSSGNKIGSIQMVEDSLTNYSKDWPKITIRPDDSYIVTWHDERPTPYPMSYSDIYIQMFDSEGNKVGKNRMVNDDTTGSEWRMQFNPSISSDSSGNFIVAWQDDRLQSTSGYEIYSQKYDKEGNKIGGNFIVNEFHENWENINPIVRMRKNGDFVVGWTGSHPSNWLSYFQRYKNGTNPFGNNRLLTNQSPEAVKYYGDIAFYEDKVISVWQDERKLMHGEIYCNILSFQNPDSTVGIRIISEEIPKECKLYQNYPNPFNPVTKIKYMVAKYGRWKTEKEFVSIKIYDILGKEVAVLVNEKQSPGVYEVTFDIKNLPSGMYLYSMYIDGIRIETKKMMFLK